MTRIKPKYSTLNASKSLITRSNQELFNANVFELLRHLSETKVQTILKSQSGEEIQNWK